MAPSKSSRKTQSKEAALVDELAEILDARSLMELELETEEVAIRLSRNATGQAVLATPAATLAPTLAAAPAANPAATPAPAGESAAAAADKGGAGGFDSHPGAVKSPMVGTAFSSPEPGAAEFISEGKPVRKGQTLLIIEAMKVMNPITAPQDGTVTKILFSNAQPVEFDQVLVVIE
ncbi:MAG: acetyl-CoA carboxylase biotin carboxyl carrier protein [Alphaproteobacteria bacterium]|jgi:acetyl-CoA carboxylase biotin carboxyl carrier protein|nr:acetyl-CoA carboxylase biotin carboxyl carrier protein [Alphaproteobacteria bacterium]